MNIGLLVPLSGEYASAGAHCKRGFEVASTILDQTPGLREKFNFIYGDSRATGRESLAEFKRMVEIEDVLAVGLIRSPVGMSLNPHSKNQKIAIMGGVAHADFIKTNPYSYRFWHTVDSEGEVLARLLVDAKQLKVAQLTTEDDWTISLAEAQRDAFKENNISVLYQEEFNPNYTDFKVVISKIKQLKPDALILNLGVASLGVALKQFEEQGVSLHKYTPFWAGSKDVIDVAGRSALSNATYFEMDMDKPNFLAKHKELFPDFRPITATYSCYTTLAGIIDAFTKYSPLTPEQAIESLNKLESVTTLDDPLPMIGREVQFEIVTRSFDGTSWN